MGKKYNKISYIVFVIYLITQVLSITSFCFDNSVIVTTLKYIRYVCYFWFVLIICINIKKITAIDIALIIFGLLVALFSKNNYIFILAIIIVSFKEISIEHILKISFFTFLICFCLVLIMAFLKIIPDWTIYRGSIMRHSLGFIYPTDCFSLFLVIVLLYYYIRDIGITYYELIALFLGNIFLYTFTNGRLSFILINVMLLLIVVMKLNKLKKIKINKRVAKVCKLLICFVPVILFFLTNMLIFMYEKGNNTAYKIDSILSRRIKYSAEAYENYGITPLGQKIEWKGWGGYNSIKTKEKYVYNYVDNSFVRILLEYGIITTIIILLGYTELLLYCWNKNKTSLVIIILFVLFWSCIEPHIITVGRNIFVATFAYLLGDNNKKFRGKYEKVNQKKLCI